MKPELTAVEVTASLPGHRFGEVSKPTGEKITKVVHLRVWPGKPLTAARLAAVFEDTHKICINTHDLTWRVI